MKAHSTTLPDVILIAPQKHGDDRGYFSETFRDSWFREHVADIGFVQDNHSLSAETGTLRGLHFQTPPYAQGKLVRCIAGAIWDVAVDIRKGSAHYGQWAAAELTAENGHQLYIPPGFAHGFVTLVPATQVIYKCTDYYAPDCDAGLRWDDPDIALPWPLDGIKPTLSAKDDVQPLLANFDSPF